MDSCACAAVPNLAAVPFSSALRAVKWPMRPCAELLSSGVHSVTLDCCMPAMQGVLAQVFPSGILSHYHKMLLDW